MERPGIDALDTEITNQQDRDDPHICLRLARELIGKKQYERAVELLQCYLAPPSSRSRDERSEAMRDLAKIQPELRITWLDRARLEAPYRREIWNDLAEEFHSQSDWLNLFWACSNGIERTRRIGNHLDDAQCWGFRLFDLGAIAAWNLNVTDRAVEWGRKALQLDPNNERLKNNLECFIHRQNATLNDGVGQNRAALNHVISAHTQGVVSAGLFAGMKIPDQSSWGDGDLAPKLLGTYEQELQQPILKLLSTRSYDAMVNVGCAEGYYAVGLARLSERCCVYAFDPDQTAQQICKYAAELNSVGNRIIVDGACSTKTLELLTRKHPTLLCVIDCEGFEINLLTSELIERYAGTSDFIVECHDFVQPGITHELQQRFCKTHNVHLIQAGPRDPNRFPFLWERNDLERWLSVWEKRPCTMNWLVCTARGEPQSAERLRGWDCLRALWEPIGVPQPWVSIEVDQASEAVDPSSKNSDSISPIDVAMVCDEGFSRAINVAIASLARTQLTPIRLWLISTQSESSWARTSKIINEMGISCYVLRSEGLKSHRKKFGPIDENIWENPHYTRLLLPETLPFLSKLLYLDGDIIVRDDIRSLWDTDLKGATIGAVQDAGVLWDHQSWFLAAYAGNYFNSGVMLLDLARWRSADITARVLDWVRLYAKSSGQGKWTAWCDQSPLNRALAGEWAKLSPTWNFTPVTNETLALAYDLSAAEFLQIAESPCIYHFGFFKPWLPQYRDYVKPFYNEWMVLDQKLTM
jgi:lipopolysaccharide biosynthesis glycosyltransferase/tetratricopeptide (TPR) repeat protein